MLSELQFTIVTGMSSESILSSRPDTQDSYHWDDPQDSMLQTNQEGQLNPAVGGKPNEDQHVKNTVKSTRTTNPILLLQTMTLQTGQKTRAEQR